MNTWRYYATIDYPRKGECSVTKYLIDDDQPDIIIDEEIIKTFDSVDVRKNKMDAYLMKRDLNKGLGINA